MWFFGGKGPSGFSSNSTAEQVTQGIDGTGLIAIVTGESSGIGMQTARVLALRGVHVLIADKNVDGGKKVEDNIIAEIFAAKIVVMELDLRSMASVKNFALKYKSLCIPLNILINNAGAFLSKYMLSEDNIELHFATNYLETKTTASQSQVEGRIINVSSAGHRFKYGPSKLANILHANELARRLKEDRGDVTANLLHPEAVVTNIAREWGFLDGHLNYIGRYVFKNVQQGAATTCYVALHPQVKGVTGEYFSSCNISKPSPLARDSDIAKKLWDISLTLTSS